MLPRLEEQGEVEARVHARACAYLEDSMATRPKMSETTRADLSHKASLLFEQLHRLTMEKLLGIGRAEEMRTLPSLHAEYRRTLAVLGLDASDPAGEEPPPL